MKYSMIVLLFKYLYLVFYLKKMYSYEVVLRPLSAHEITTASAHVPIYPYLISEGRRNYDRHRNDTVTLSKHVTKYKHMR